MVNSIRSVRLGEPSSEWRSLSGRASIRWQPGEPRSTHRWLETEWPAVPSAVIRETRRGQAVFMAGNGPKSRLAGVRASEVARKRVTTVERRDAGKWMANEPERRRTQNDP